MNEHVDPLETELAAIRPLRPSAELKDRIARQLELREPSTSSPKPSGARMLFRLSLALGLAIAVFAVISIRRRDDRPNIVQAPAPRLELAIALDPSLPTVWTYHRVVSASPERIDAVLNDHARKGHSRTARTPAAEFHVSAFLMSSTELQSF